MRWGARKKMKLSWLNYLSLLLKWVWRLIECIWFLGSSFSPSPLNSSWLFHPYHPASNNKFTFFQVRKLKTDICVEFALSVTLYKIGSIFFFFVIEVDGTCKFLYSYLVDYVLPPVSNLWTSEKLSLNVSCYSVFKSAILMILYTSILRVYSIISYANIFLVSYSFLQMFFTFLKKMWCSSFLQCTISIH